MRAFVTGITGFVGGHLAEHLLERGDQVVGASKSARWPKELEHLSRSIRLEPYDLADGGGDELAESLAKKKPEAIYHLAAQANPQASVADPRGTWALNLGGALNLLEAVRAAELSARVILVGSGVCYGNPAPEHLPVSESCPLRPNNPYSSSKAAADLLGVQCALGYGMNVVVVRPFNHAGPRQTSNYVLSGLARQVAEVEAGKKERVEVGNLEVTRDFTDVRDVVRGYRILAEKGDSGEIYNLGSGRGVKLADALEILRGFSKASVNVFVDPARVRAVDQPLLVADPSKLSSSTGWSADISIEQTLADMLDYWRKDIATSGKTI